MTANLNSEGGDHAELLKIYKNFMNDKVDFISEFYPDKECSSGKDYDLSRYILRIEHEWYFTTIY